MENVVLPFGKHKGKQITQVDDVYLRWMRATLSSTSSWRKLALEVLEQRTTSRKKHLVELKSCRNLQRGKQIHAEARSSGSDSSLYVATALIDMYARSGSMVDARQVFDRIEHPDVVSWTALLLGYVDNGEAAVALDLFAEMTSRSCERDPFLFVAAVKACTSLATKRDTSKRAGLLERGRCIHSEVSFHSNAYVENALIDMYSKCGSMTEARRIFDGMVHRDVVSWNSLISGYADNGDSASALDLFSRMKSQRFEPNTITYIAALKACTSEADVRRIHLEIGCSLDMYVQSTLLCMYAKCGSMTRAHLVFDSIKQQDVIAWTALISGYAENGEGALALDLFGRMKLQGLAPNSQTFVAALKACTSLATQECLQRGKQIHSEIGSHLDSYVQSTLVDMYGKCLSMPEARQVFDAIDRPDVVSWNNIIMGYADNGESVKALDMFVKMKTQGCEPDCITYAAALKACGLLGALESGCKIYAEIQTGTDLQAMLVTSLVDFYAKCGNLTEARKLFDVHHEKRDLATWNALFTGYSRLGDNKAVFRLFEEMLDAGIKPNGVTFLCILTCCSHAGLSGEAKRFFKAMADYGMTPAVEHYACMVDVLGRCNKLDEAMALLQSMPCRPDAVTWMTALGACHNWKNVWVARLAFQSLVSLDGRNAAAYVQMARIFQSKGMRKEQQMVLRMRSELQVRKEPEQTCWTNENSEHIFFK